MITAKEALNLSVSLDSAKIKALLDVVDRNVRKNASEGERGVRVLFDTSQCSAANAKKVIAELQKNGFGVVYHSWSDQRDGCAYHQIDVTW